MLLRHIQQRDDPAGVRPDGGSVERSDPHPPIAARRNIEPKCARLDSDYAMRAVSGHVGKPAPVPASGAGEYLRDGQAVRKFEELLGRGIEHDGGGAMRSEEHTSELQSLMRISYAVFCLTK